jgi:sulfatase maturation enzyme AslB (radical SAM superfamily)
MAYSKKDSILTDPTRAQKVGFTGGEPLQNIPDLEKIIEYCIENKKLKMHLHTNGTLITPQIAKWLKENNIETTLTVFGTTVDIHEKSTNTDARAGHDLCYSASNSVHIDSYGNVFPCTAASGRKEFSAGNVFLYNYSLWDLWQNSPLFQLSKNSIINPKESVLTLNNIILVWMVVESN